MKQRRGTYTRADLLATLARFEREHKMPSDEFFGLWESGAFPPRDDYFEWAGLCGSLGIVPKEPKA